MSIRSGNFSATSKAHDSLTIVVVSIVGGEVLRRCLAALPTDVEERVAIVRCEGDQVLAKQFGCRVIDGSKCTVPARRVLALRTAKSDLVALLEDTCVPEVTWESAVRSAFEDPKVAAVGGSTVFDPRLPGRYLALACAEYGRYYARRYRASLSYNGDKNVDCRFPGLAGNNMAIRRSRFLRLPSAENGLFESEVAEALVSAGWRLVFEPRMTVTYCSEDRIGARSFTRFQHGRLFAGRQADDGGVYVRALGILKTPLLPIVLSVRAIRMTYSQELRSGMPVIFLWLILQQSAWSFGELVGYFLGPGQSLDSWH